MTTQKGLPFATLEKETYDSMANWMTKTIPGVDKKWVYDALSYDVMEIVSASLSMVTLVYALNKNEMAQVNELLGSMGIISITSANPIMGIFTIASIAYMVKTGQKLDKWKIIEGGGYSALSTLLFASMSAPFIIEFVIVLTIMHLLKKNVNAENADIMKNYVMEFADRVNLDDVLYSKDSKE